MADLGKKDVYQDILTGNYVNVLEWHRENS